TMFLISRGRVSHSEAAPNTIGSGLAAPSAAPTGGSTPKIAPNSPSVKAPARNSVNLPDPTSYPEALLLSGDARKRGERADHEANARAALDRFFARGQLDSTQQGQFMQILEDLNAKLMHRGDEYMKTGDPAKKSTVAERDAIEHEGYQRVKG